MNKYKLDFNQRVLVQSMTNTKTKNIQETIKQIKDMYNLGCDLVRVAIFDDEDMAALKSIVKLSPIPIIADIHFNYLYAIKAIESGVAKIRLNPGNIYKEEEIIQIINKAKEHDVWIRIGVNEGSIQETYLEKYNLVDAMINSLKDYLEVFKKYNFDKIVISLKCSDPLLNVEVNQKASKQFKYPIHLGVTEAGTLINSCLKSSIGIAPLLLNKIGNTIRISISDDPLYEVKIAHQLLNILKIENNRVNVIACPTCGRLNYDMFSLVDKVEKYCENLFFPLKISILGCTVNGIGEGKMADIGIAGNLDKAILFVDGKIVKTIKSEDAFDELKKVIDEKYQLFLKMK